MAQYQLVFTHQAKKDLKNLEKSSYRESGKKFLISLGENPYAVNKIPMNKYIPKRYKIKLGDCHRITFSIFDKEKVVKVYCAWGHYSDRSDQ